MVEHVGEIKVQRAAEPLGHPDLLGDTQVQIPQWQAAEEAATADLSVQAKDRAANGIADYAVNGAACVGVAECVDAGSRGAAPVGTVRVEVGAAAARDRASGNHVLVRGYVSSVALTEGPAVSSLRTNLVREAAAINEERREAPAAERVSDDALLAGIVRWRVVEEQVEVVLFVVGLNAVLVMQIPRIDGGVGFVSLCLRCSSATLGASNARLPVKSS